jgi:hypothetical protein
MRAVLVAASSTPAATRTAAVGEFDDADAVVVFGGHGQLL